MGIIFLIGYMGCGKSTLGRKVARRLGIAFVDTDALIEECEGASVADIFRYEGEERFRAIEREVLERIIAADGDRVVATGGGLPTWSHNMELMNRAGFTIYLRRDAEHILPRLSAHGRQKRPRLRGLNDAELVEFMAQDISNRELYYSQAQLVIDCNTITDNQAVEEIMQNVKCKMQN